MGTCQYSSEGQASYFRKIELLRLLPKGGVVMSRIEIDQDYTVGRDSIPPQFVCCDDFAAEDTDGWIETQRFLKDHARVGEIRKILNGWYAATKDLVQFGMQKALD